MAPSANKSNQDNIMIIIDYTTGRAVSSCDALGKVLFNEPALAKKLLATKDRSKLSYFGESDTIEYQLRAAGLTDEANEIINIKKKYSVGNQITDTGRLCAAFYLAPSLSYPMFGFKYITDIKELPSVWQTYGLRGRNGAKLIDSLSDPAFSYWLWHKNPHMALKVRKMQESKASSGEIAFAMFPNMSANFKIASRAANRIETPEQIGKDLNARIVDYISNHCVPAGSLIDFGLDSGGEVEGYLKSHQQYASKITCLKNILHNRKKWACGQYGPYNPFVALFSLVKAFGVKPYYEFKDGTKIYDLEQLKNIPAEKIEEAFNSGHLSAWIATFFQDDPDKSLNDEVSYAKEVQKFTDYIASIYPSYAPVSRYKKALREIDETAKQYRNVTRFSITSILLKCIFVPLTVLSFLLVIFLTFQFHIPDYNIITNHYLGFSLVIGAVVLVYTLAAGLTLFEALLWGGIVGFGGTWVLKLLMGFISPYLTWVYLAIILTAFIFFMVKLWPVYQSVPGYAYVIDVGHPDFRLREMNALNYAYGSKASSERGDDKIATYLRSYKSAKKDSQKSQFGYVLSGIATSFFLMVGLYFLSPAFGGEHSLLNDTANAEGVETPVAEPTDSVKPKAKKKAARKAKSKAKTAAPAAIEDNTPATGAPTDHTYHSSGSEINFFTK